MRFIFLISVTVPVQKMLGLISMCREAHGLSALYMNSCFSLPPGLWAQVSHSSPLFFPPKWLYIETYNHGCSCWEKALGHKIQLSYQYQDWQKSHFMNLIFIGIPSAGTWEVIRFCRGTCNLSLPPPPEFRLDLTPSNLLRQNCAISP